MVMPYTITLVSQKALYRWCNVNSALRTHYQVLMWHF